METNEIIKLYVIFSITILLVVITFVILFVQFIKVRNQLMKEKLEKEMLSYKNELLALRSQMNPHFVFNALNTVQYYISKNMKDASESFIIEFSQLIRQFFEFSRHETISIEEEINFLENYLSVEKQRFDGKFDYQINISDEIDDEDEIPSMLLQPIVENAVNHGIFHLAKDGLITIDFKQIADELHIEIIDNGIGIERSKKINKQNKYQHKTHATNVINERLNLLENYSQWTVDYQTVDRSKISDNQGTLVKLKIKRDDGN